MQKRSLSKPRLIRAWQGRRETLRETDRACACVPEHQNSMWQMHSYTPKMEEKKKKKKDDSTFDFGRMRLTFRFRLVSLSRSFSSTSLVSTRSSHGEQGATTSAVDTSARTKRITHGKTNKPFTSAPLSRSFVICHSAFPTPSTVELGIAQRGCGKEFDW